MRQREKCSYEKCSYKRFDESYVYGFRDPFSSSPLLPLSSPLLPSPPLSSPLSSPRYDRVLRYARHWRHQTRLGIQRRRQGLGHLRMIPPVPVPAPVATAAGEYPSAHTSIIFVISRRRARPAKSSDRNKEPSRAPTPLLPQRALALEALVLVELLHEGGTPLLPLLLEVRAKHGVVPPAPPQRACEWGR